MRLSRRTLLRGLLGGAAVSIALPPLEAFLNATGTAYAGDDGFPTRFGLFFWGNGMLPERWVPTGEGEGDAWALSDQLAPLARHKDVITVVSGTRLEIENRVPHASGAAGLLSGAPLLPGDESSFQLPSIDQLLAAELGGLTRFRSIESGVDCGAGLSYTAPHSRNPPETSPHAMFERLFGTGFTLPGDEPIVDPKLALRRSVLDAVMDDARRVQARVGAADRARLEQHLDGIRDLELRLARMEEDPPNYESCAYPLEPLGDYPDVQGRPQIAARSRAMCDMLAMALACDQTRVFAHYLTRPVASTLFPGATAGHHQLTHDEPGDQPEVHAIVVQIQEEYAYLLDALRAVPEGDGVTLLDHCAILGTTEVSLGRTHSLEEMPLVYAGSAGGRLRTGAHVRAQGDNTGRVMLSLIRAMGLAAPTFGAGDGLVSDGLASIER